MRVLWTGEYDRARALTYARRWALDRNPLFYNFTEVGGDCTNFVSQSVLAGSCVMNFTPDFGWYYLSVDDRAPAFTGVDAFWRFFVGDPEFAAENGGVGPFGREAPADEIEPGDVVQLGRASGEYYHTLLVTGRSAGDILVAAHSNDAYDRPLSSYPAPLIRYLHIEGVRFELPFSACAEDLIAGRALPV
jgi:hypothetical protein